MEWFRAQDTFTADLADGTVVRVVKGEPYPDSHELVKRDQDAAKVAAKAGIDRLPLFRPLEQSPGEEAPAKPRAVARRRAS